MLPENLNSTKEPPPDVNQILRTGVGLVLIILGLLPAGWVLFQIYTFFKDPSSIKIFQELALTQRGVDPSVVPPEVWFYGLPLFLLSIAAGIAGALISAGARLLSGSLDALESALVKQFNAFREQVNSKLTGLDDKLEARLNRLEDKLKQ